MILGTLTEVACGVALGEHIAGLWSTSDDLQKKLLDAASKTGERIWPMPLADEYTEQIKSEVAAWKNTGGRLGGACTAAAFLKAFTGDTPWAHLDIAYTAELKTRARRTSTRRDRVSAMPDADRTGGKLRR